MPKFTINSQLVTLNEYIEIERANKYKAASVKKSQTNKCAWLIKAQKVQQVSFKVDLNVTWYNYRQDSDNIAFSLKFVLDGMKQAGVIKDDSQKYIRDLHHFIRKDKNTKSKYCVVELAEVVE